MLKPEDIALFRIATQGVKTLKQDTFCSASSEQKNQKITTKTNSRARGHFILFF
ncbi:Smr protein/MutS2 C-terminal family protein [Pasteurella canis]|uniref:Smr protein/MutS2 C-terminal family protein n=1 Tax=Pasteurella canis TaxID=753 RepID=A0A379GFB0_9PAST|nr:Smr protein/MutS2 C-terminal family protein [Pasteurella canis]